MILVKAFGYTIALAALFTSLAMIIMGARWQKIERSAYAGEKRPWWFILLSALILLFYLSALVRFIGADVKTVAGWFMMAVIPIGWGLKAALVVFNQKGRKTVSDISGDQAWIKVGLARLPVVLIFALLAYFA
ncbi:MAG: hypothetical protein K0Q65_626 [Clostridia bacterium]|nr:hypothetical protein [Clostridia bacterium]